MYLVYEERCTGCGACLTLCSRGAVCLKQDVAKIDLQRCGECGVCIDACRQDAIYDSNQPSRVVSKPRPMYGREEACFPLEQESRTSPGTGGVKAGAASSGPSSFPAKVAGYLSRRLRGRSGF